MTNPSPLQANGTFGRPRQRNRDSKCELSRRADPMREPVVLPTSKYFSKEWKNPVARKFSHLLDKVFGHSIFPARDEVPTFTPDMAALYISKRESHLDVPFQPL